MIGNPILFHSSVIKKVNYSSAHMTLTRQEDTDDDEINRPDGSSSNPSQLIKRLQSILAHSKCPNHRAWLNSLQDGTSVPQSQDLRGELGRCGRGGLSDEFVS